MPHLIALDVDGPITLCVVRTGDRDLTHSRCIAAAKIDGLNPADRVVYESDGARFVLHTPDGFASTGADSSRAGQRVRVTDALAWAIENCGSDSIRVTSALRFADCFTEQGGGDALQDGLSLLDATALRSPNPLALNIVDRQVFPRTVAAYIEWACDENAERLPERSADESTLMVDVGLSETTVTRFQPDALPEPGSERIVAHGWRPCAERLSSVLAHAHGVQAVRTEAVLNILMTGVYRAKGQTYSAAAQIHQSMGRLASVLAETVLTLSPRKNEPIVVVGVPAVMVAAALELLTGLRVRVPDDPAFANARGLLKFANFPAPPPEEQPHGGV